MDRLIRDRGLYLFGPFRLDPVKRLLWRADDPVALTPTVFDALLHLVENPGRVVPKEELLDAVWRGRTVSDANLSQTIFTLRRALGDGDARARMILTAPGQGYRFTPDVRRLGETEKETQTQTYAEAEARPFAPPAPAKRGRRHVAVMTAAGLGFGAIVGLGSLLVWFGGFGGFGGSSVGVVLTDFSNLTGEPVFDRTPRKIVEIDLAQSPRMKVTSDKAVQDTLTLMTRPGDTPLTPALAGEVCQRVNANAVVDGAVARLGASYLLTLTATDCAGARTLAAEKTTVANQDAVVAALGRLVDRVRGRLGESEASIRRFGAPMLPQRTPSLAALKAYSEAAWRVARGQRLEAIPLFQHAVELDPSFAMAYAGLSSVYTNLHDSDRSAEVLTKAYALRETLADRQRYLVTARYDESVANDTLEAIDVYRAWTESYPDEAKAWSNLSNALNWIGRYDEAVAPARRGLALNPTAEPSYVVLARALMHAGQLDAAAEIGRRAMAAGLAGEDMHGVLTEIAAGRNDQASIDRELAWGNVNGARRPILIFAARHALSQGKVRQAEAMYGQASAMAAEQGVVDYTLPFQAREYADLGLMARARSILAHIPAASEDDSDFIFAQAEFGDPERARALIDKALKQAPRDTLTVNIFAPESRAALAWREGRPAEAVADLNPALPYEMHAFDTPYLRGRLYLALRDGPRAVAEFKKILDHPDVEPTSPLRPLARLGLARALRLEGDRDGARRAYAALIAGWTGADPGFPPLDAARAENASL